MSSPLNLTNKCHTRLNPPSPKHKTHKQTQTNTRPHLELAAVVDSLNAQCEDCVAAAALLVELGAAHCALLHGARQQLFNILFCDKQTYQGVEISTVSVTATSWWGVQSLASIYALLPRAALAQRQPALLTQTVHSLRVCAHACSLLYLWCVDVDQGQVRHCCPAIGVMHHLSVVLEGREGGGDNSSRTHHKSMGRVVS